MEYFIAGFDNSIIYEFNSTLYQKNLNVFALEKNKFSLNYYNPTTKEIGREFDCEEYKIHKVNSEFYADKVIYNIIVGVNDIYQLTYYRNNSIVRLFHSKDLRTMEYINYISTNNGRTIKYVYCKDVITFKYLDTRETYIYNIKTKNLDIYQPNNEDHPKDNFRNMKLKTKHIINNAYVATPRYCIDLILQAI
jgi:hypothetical protein